MKKLTIEEKCYVAGFLDGNGSIFAEIIPDNNYEYNFRIRVSISFYLHKSKHWFMLKLKKLLRYGTLKSKNDNVSELIIAGTDSVEIILLQLNDHLVLKKPNASLILEIIKKKRNITSKEKFIEVCKLVDKIALLNSSKNQSITSETVKESL